MSALTDVPHLRQIPLTPKDLSILADLQAWLSTARFGDTDSGGKICVDEKLSEKWDWLCTMDFVQKVRRTATKRASKLHPHWRQMNQAIAAERVQMQKCKAWRKPVILTTRIFNNQLN